MQTVLFVVFCCFPFSRIVWAQVVIRCTCCFSCFPYISKKTQQGLAAFPEKAAAKVVLCCFPFSRHVRVLRLLYVVLVVQVVFPMSARRPSKDGLLFLKKLPQKLFFVVSPLAGLSDLTGCYTLYLLFKLFSLYQQEDAARTGCFSWKSCRKSCSLLFPL